MVFVFEFVRRFFFLFVFFVLFFLFFCLFCFFCFFFFKQKTAYEILTCDWSSDVCSSDLIDHWWQTETSWAISANCTGIEMMKTKYGSAGKAVPGYDVRIIKPDQTIAATRSEERRVGKECRSRRSPYH